MKTNPLISVVVTNFNHARFIDEAVASVEHQSYKNIEIIIVDDGSQDDGQSKAKLQEYKKRGHKTIEIPTNKGKWFALNTAIEQARGSLVTLQDADDSAVEQRIERQLSCLQMMGSLHNLCAFTHCFTEQDIIKAKLWKTDIDIEDSSVMNHYDVTQAVFFGLRTPGINHYFTGEGVEAHGASSMFYKQHWDMGLRFNPPEVGLRVCNSEDSDHNTRMTLLLQRTSVLIEPLYCYRRGTSTNNEKK